MWAVACDGFLSGVACRIKNEDLNVIPKLLFLFAALVPMAARADIEFTYPLKGKIVGMIERDGKCFIAIESSLHAQYSNAYHHIDNSDTCSDALIAYRLREPVEVVAFFYSDGNRGSTTHGIRSIELKRDGKAYWPPYGQRK